MLKFVFKENHKICISMWNVLNKYKIWAFYAVTFSHFLCNMCALFGVFWCIISSEVFSSFFSLSFAYMIDFLVEIKPHTNFCVYGMFVLPNKDGEKGKNKIENRWNIAQHEIYTCIIY